MNRADTEAYRTPKKMIVGIMNENAIFLYSGIKDPKAGEVMYWFPTNAYVTAPTMLNTRISRIVHAQRALGKSLGSRISAMKLGRVICPINV